MARVYRTAGIVVLALLAGSTPSALARAEAQARWAAVVTVDLTRPPEGEVFRVARVESELVLPREALSDPRTLSFALPGEACGLDEMGKRTCAPVTVESVRWAMSGEKLEFRAGQGLLDVTLPANAAGEDDVDLLVRYDFPAFARGSGLFGLSGTDHWIPLERHPIGNVLLEVTCPAAERVLAGGAPMGEELSGKTRRVTYGQVDGRRPGLLVGPLGPTAPAVEGLVDTTLVEGVAIEPELVELLSRTANGVHNKVGDTRRVPIHAVVAPFLTGSPGAPLVGAPGAFADRLLLLHDSRPTDFRDVVRADRLFEMPTRQIPRTDAIVRAGVYSHWSGAVPISSESRDAWLHEFIAGALEDRTDLADPWGSPVGLLRRDHGALWPGDPIPEEASLGQVGYYLAQLMRLRLGEQQFERLLDTTLAASGRAPLTTAEIFEIWDYQEALFDVVQTFKDVLNARDFAYHEVAMTPMKVGEAVEGGGWDAKVVLTRHKGHEGLNAVHVAVVTESGEIRDTWAIVGAKGGQVDVVGLTTKPIEAFLVRDCLGAAITSADLVPKGALDLDFDLD